MDISRRWFLGGALAATAAATIPLVRALPEVPLILADGIHDDTAGLQALFDRRPVDLLNDEVTLLRSDEISLVGGVFRTTNTLRIRSDSMIVLHGCTFHGDFSASSDRPIIHIVEAPHVYLNALQFRS